MLCSMAQGHIPYARDTAAYSGSTGQHQTVIERSTKGFLHKNLPPCSNLRIGRWSLPLHHRNGVHEWPSSGYCRSCQNIWIQYYHREGCPSAELLASQESRHVECKPSTDTASWASQEVKSDYTDDAAYYSNYKPVQGSSRCPDQHAKE